MTTAEQKIVQYLNEAHATERALVRVLQSQIAMTPRGRYRQALESHLRETEEHAERVSRRIQQLGGGGNPLQAGIGLVQVAIGQVIALGKTPLDLARGTGGEEKVLKNAKDAAASEALEIATYTALERLARSVGDTDTAELARDILADEEKMMNRVLGEIPRLTEAVVRAEVEGKPSFDASETGAADAARAVGERVTRGARRGTAKAKRTARQARRVPGVARAEGQIKGAVASARDLPIASYDNLNASDVAERLSELSQVDLAKIDSYERRHQNRTTVLARITALRGQEPWPGYDDQSVAQVRSALDAGDDSLARNVRSYERSHKNRNGVIEATERELAHTS